jgi:hypothetical protein
MDHVEVRVADVMAGIEASVRDEPAPQLVARGAAADFRDADIFARVHQVLARAADRRDPHALLLPELLADEDGWQPSVNLAITSHRRVVGPLIVFVKRRLILPLVRWLFEFTDENFRRQDYVNRVVMACLEELAIENACLRRDLHALAGHDRAGAAKPGGDR